MYKSNNVSEILAWKAMDEAGKEVGRADIAVELARGNGDDS